MAGLMLVFTENKTPRIEYAIPAFLKLAGIEKVEITSDESFFKSSSEKKINYSTKNFVGILQIVPHGLLSETGIKKQDLRMEKWEETTCFFKTSKSQIPFDIFAASFWLMARYEECLPFTEDQHSRFSGKDSFLFKNQLLLNPVIDEWGNKLLSVLNIEIKKEVKKTLTIDVDNAFAYANKGFIRSLGGCIRNLARFDFKSIGDRLKTIRGKMKDPFDTYDIILQKAAENKVDLKFFFLLGDRTKYDTNLSHQTEELRKKISFVASKVEVGIHPSYASFLSEEKVKTEVQRLENIIGKKVILSRQHFLRMQLPQSYQILIANGITEDHTMGFADEPGYRAGTSKPYFWYDLKNEKATSLRVFPFVMMDATLKRYLGLSPDQAIEYSRKIYEKVKQTGGNFTLLWHNESVNDYHNWKGWKKVLDEQLKLQ